MNDCVTQLFDKWSCCSLATAALPLLPQRERAFFSSFMPTARTAIALGHHITTEAEWTWYATPDGGEHCAADDLEVCQAIKGALMHLEHDAEIVGYPGTSGLQFRYVAQAAGLGEIGANAFLFHPQWGPWVHLRVIATTAEIDIRTQISGSQLCNHCGLCSAECPAGAISEDSFDGVQCRTYRETRGEYEPFGPSREFKYCNQCVMACPQCHRPSPR